MFLPTGPKKDELAKIFNFCVFHPILINFGMGTNNGPKTAQNQFEAATTIFLTYQPDQPNLYFSFENSKWPNLVKCYPIWFKLSVEVIYSPLIRKLPF